MEASAAWENILRAEREQGEEMDKQHKRCHIKRRVSGTFLHDVGPKPWEQILGVHWETIAF